MSVLTYELGVFEDGTGVLRQFHRDDKKRLTGIDRTPLTADDVQRVLWVVAPPPADGPAYTWTRYYGVIEAPPLVIEEEAIA